VAGLGDLFSYGSERLDAWHSRRAPDQICAMKGRGTDLCSQRVERVISSAGSKRLAAMNCSRHYRRTV